MSKQYNIRWSDKDYREIERVVRNYNAKIRRVKKNQPELAEYLPETLSVRKLKKDITKRSDLKRQYSDVGRFLKKGSEETVESGTGYKLSKYALAKQKNQIRILNIINTKKRKKLEISKEKGNIQQAKELNIEPRELEMYETFEEFKMKSEAIRIKISASMQDKMLEDYRENYYKALKELGANGGDIKKILDKLTKEELFALTNKNAKLIINFYYDKNFSQQELAEGILEEWNQVIE